MDPTDEKILATLDHNARISATAIGKEIGLSRTAVQDRIARMENNGTIVGYKVVSRPQAQPAVQALIFITLAERPCAPALIWLRSLKNVVRVSSLSGALDAMVEVHLYDHDALSRLNDLIAQDPRIKTANAQIVLSVL